MTLGRRGLLLAVAAAASIVVAWIFGLPEVAIVGAAGLVLVAASAASLVLRPPALDTRRVVHPTRVPMGEPCEVRVTAANPGTRRSPVLTLCDEVGRFGQARLQLAPISPGSRSTALYSLPTNRRGVHRIGPLTLTDQDPFGLVVRRREQPEVVGVMVLAPTWPLAPLPGAAGDEPEHGSRSLTSLSTVDEEFASLREYVPGDDIRRIHWPSTARLGAPVVRQFDVPWQRRTTVLLDLRAAAHDDASFERAVSAAASVVELAAARDELVRFVTTAGADAGFVPATGHLEELQDRLAMIEPDVRDEVRDGRLVSTLDDLRTSTVGRLVCCVGTVDPPAAAALARLDRSVDVLVVVTTSASGAAQPVRTSVHHDGTRRLDVEWEHGLRSLTAGIDRR